MSKRLSSFWVFVCLSVTFGLSPAWAGSADIKITPLTIQEEFKNLSKEVGLAISYLPLAPAESLGLLGFDVGIELTAADINQDKSFWTNVVSSPPDYLLIPKLHVQKGLPFGIDLGAVYATVPQSNIEMMGAELKWAFISGNLVLPAIALRTSYTQLRGVSGLELTTLGANLSISKSFAFVTPYAGAGMTQVKSQATGLPLAKERLDLSNLFVGVKISLLLINFVAEANFSDIPLYTGRFNIGF